MVFFILLYIMFLKISLEFGFLVFVNFSWCFFWVKFSGFRCEKNMAFRQMESRLLKFLGFLLVNGQVVQLLVVKVFIKVFNDCRIIMKKGLCIGYFLLLYNVVCFRIWVMSVEFVGIVCSVIRNIFLLLLEVIWQCMVLVIWC